MTQTKDGGGGCDFPQGIIGLIVTLERQRWQQRGGGTFWRSPSPGASL